MELDNLSKQLWFADDAAAAGRLQALKQWWDRLAERGPQYGYSVNPSKTWLVVKECHLNSAKELFKDTGVQVTTKGKVYLGSFIGPDDKKDLFVQDRVDSWLGELEELSSIVITQPHAAFCAFTHGVMNKWRYLFRTTGEIADSLSRALRRSHQVQVGPCCNGTSSIQ